MEIISVLQQIAGLNGKICREAIVHCLNEYQLSLLTERTKIYFKLHIYKLR